jgi:hypothetical protein
MCTNKRFLEETGWQRMAQCWLVGFFFTGFPLFPQEAIACDTRQGTRRLFFFPNGWVLAVLLTCFARI